jgi:hypothetical protein
VCEREREREREKMDITRGRLVVGEEDVCSKNSNAGTKERIADAILNKTIHEIRWWQQINERTNERSFISPVKASRVQRKLLASATGACGIP